MKVKALKLSVGALQNVAALEYETAEELVPGSPRILEDYIKTLYSPADFVKAPFVLDPENPILTIDGLEVTGVQNLGGGERAVIYRLGLRNGGDVRLDDTTVARDFASTFGNARSFDVQCVDGDGLAENLTYDGDLDAELLAAGNSLAIAQTNAIDIVVNVLPEISSVGTDGCFGAVEYSATSTGTATSPIGTPIMNRYDHCRDVYRSPEIVSSIDLGGAVLPPV